MQLVQVVDALDKNIVSSQYFSVLEIAYLGRNLIPYKNGENNPYDSEDVATDAWVMFAMFDMTLLRKMATLN